MTVASMAGVIDATFFTFLCAIMRSQDHRRPHLGGGEHFHEYFGYEVFPKGIRCTKGTLKGTLKSVP